MDIESFSQDGLDNIKSVNILTDENLEIVKAMQSQLQDSFNKRQIFRTDTEARYSVLTDMKFPTPASKYWQSVREQNVHFTNLMMESCDYEEKQGEVELLEAEIESISKITTPMVMAKIKIKKAQIKKHQFQLLDLKRVAQDRVREIQQWEIIKQEEIKKDSTFDTKNCNTHQFESYTKRFTNELKIAEDAGNFDLYKASLSQLDTIKNRDNARQLE